MSLLLVIIILRREGFATYYDFWLGLNCNSNDLFCNIIIDPNEETKGTERKNKQRLR